MSVARKIVRAAIIAMALPGEGSIAIVTGTDHGRETGGTVSDMKNRKGTTTDGNHDITKIGITTARKDVSADRVLTVITATDSPGRKAIALTSMRAGAVNIAGACAV